MTALPSSVHVSKHPCLMAKLSQLRSKSTSSRETQQLVHDISMILGMEALASLDLTEGGTSQSTTDATTAIIVDPVIATGGTAIAAIQTLREWGVKKVIVINVITAAEGLTRAAEEWAEGTEFWVGAVDAELTGSGMIKPGVGDIGDRLYGTIGK
ncbi:hypothetical protein LTR24_008083 [Lithohypha guttulata]|uniref:Phosphoribosyltransferase domain-containing protein n=1 Tax=Lithohypha guttulata TaxID=1690604 RepID=A0ABR0K1H9_9EURO|nr:hypothetical protein LTR24_008083 [Lithohypha guttulata]